KLVPFAGLPNRQGSQKGTINRANRSRILALIHLVHLMRGIYIVQRTESFVKGIFQVVQFEFQVRHFWSQMLAVFILFDQVVVLEYVFTEPKSDGTESYF